MSRLRRCLRVVWLPALALVVACDLLLTDPATTPSTVEIQFQIEGEPLGATAEAFQRVSRVLVRLTIPDSVPRDTIVSVTPDDDAVRTGVKLRPAEQVDGLSILTRLGSEEVWLFQGETVASIEPGVPAEAEIALEPIPAQVSPDRDPVVIPNPGETVELESAVLYASGDTIPGLTGTWTSSSPGVMTVTAEGLATAVAVGEGELVVAYDTLPPDTVTAIVSSVDNGTVTPADTSVVAGSTVQYSVTFRDAFGNVLTDRATTWSTDDATVATIDPDTGLLTAVAPGTVTVIATAEGVDATTGLTVFLPVLSIDDVTVLEGDAGTTAADFTVTLSAASAQQVTVDYATADGTATAGSDYTATSGTLTFAVGGALTQQITVPVLGDLMDEGTSETFTVELTGAVNVSIADGSGTGTITDDDAAPSLAIDDVTVLEGDAGTTTADFTVTLSAASAQQVTVDYATADGTATAPDDYTATSGTLTFAAGTTSQTISVAFSDDALDEADETFTVELTNATNATIADGSGLGTITDDDAAPSLSIDDVTVLEGDAGTTTADFTVTLSAASAQQVSVDYATADGTATTPDDYTATSGTLTFAAGTTSQTISVAFSDDALDEADETFTVGLSNATNATIADGSGTGTITDDDDSSSVEWINANGGLWSNGANWSTGSAPASGDSVEITLDGTYTVDVDVDPAVANLTVGGVSGSQTLSASSGTIDVAGTLAVQGTGLLVLNTVTLNAAGVTNSSSFNHSWTSVTTGAPISNDGIIGFGGSSSLTGALTTTGGSLLQLTGTAELTIADGFTNNGVISLEGDNLLTVTSGTLTNQSGATIELLNSGSTVSASLDNAGSLTIGTSAGLTWSQASTSIANSGIITANGPLTVQSGESVTNSGTIDLVSSDATFAMTSTGTFSTSGTISTGTGTTLIVSGGTFDYTGGSFAVGGSVRLANLAANFTPTITLGTDGPEVLTLNGVTLNAPSVTNPATLSQQWTDLTAGADIINEGIISFSGASSLNGTLTTAVGSSIGLEGSAGVTVPGGFTNNGTLTFTSNSGVTTSTGPLVNADGAVIEVTGTGSGIGGDLQNVGIVDLAADFLLDGQLIVPSTSSGTFTGSGGALSATSVDIDGAIFDNVPLRTTGGALTALNNLTFQNMDPAATQLTVTHPGAATPFAFSGVSFLTPPTTGLYISANDNASDGNTLGIDLTNSVPTDGSAETATSGGAVVRWLDASTPGFTVTESGGTTVVDESGTTDDFSVVLDEQPFDDVVLTVTSADLGEATVSPTTLTFTSLSWSTPQTVTVTGVDDSVADGDQVTAVTISVDDANSDDQFDALADQTVSATTTDDDVAGFTVTESGGTTVVDESGTTDDFTMVLDAQPLSNVVISVTSGDLGEVITDTDTLTFTPDNWNVAQTVTVAGVSDTPLDDGDQLTDVTLSVDDANSDDQFDLVADQTVSVTTVDIDPLMAFTSGVTGNNDVWLRTGGGDLTQLTTDPEADWDPEWSPDGQQIVFSSARDGLNDHVWIMNADGTEQTALTRDPVQHVYPSWSPDGSQIVFARDTANLRDIWVMNRDGSNPTELMANEFEDSQPDWSPDGTQIAFFSDRTGTWQVFTMGADGSNPTNRSNNDAFEFFPAWSPDGTHIAFVSNRHDPGNFNNWQIYVLDTTEFLVTRLTNNAAQDLQPAWTPDGRIVFSSDRDGDQEIYIMNRDGTNQVRLTTIDGADQFPSIKPEG